MSEPARFDGCEVVEQLRRGAVSELYRAVQRPLGRPVLIKSIGASILPSSPFAATLEREARMLAELDHSNIVELYDFVRRDDRMWMVLEYVDGWSLDEIQKRVKQVPEAAAIAIALEVGRALGHAHDKRIIHRDLQPRNILVSRRGELKLTNFAAASDARLDTSPELLDGGASYTGPAYMSPEQILGEPLDPSSDQFSLGVILYELLSGERPFMAPDERNESLRIRSEPPPPLGRRVSTRSAVERVVVRCLEKLPGDRYRNTRELLGALEAAKKELGGGETSTTLLGLLGQAGLVRPEARPKEEALPPDLLPRSTPMTVARASAGILLAFLLLMVGGAGIQWAARRGEARAGTGAGRRLELVPQNAAYLRVVAQPWAHVVVDGQRVDTTPFARSIPLGVGTHYVRLEHPNAPVERRTVKVLPGETVLLNISMRVSLPAPEPTNSALVPGVPSADPDDTSP